MSNNAYYTRLESELKQWREEKTPFLPSRLFGVFATPREARADEFKRRVAAVLAEYLDDISYEQILRTDVQMRQSTSMEWYADWTLYRIEDFLTDSMSEDERRAVVIFASFHCCGYIRQRAVRILPDYPATLPFITLRMTDWVAPVYQETLQAFARQLPQASDREVIESLPMTEWVKEHSDPHACILMFAPRLADNIALFERILAAPNIRVRRIGISNIREFLPTRYGEMLIDHLPRESNPLLRQLILKTLLDSDLNLRPCLEILLRDKYPKNRGLALSSLYDTDPTAGAIQARDMLLDRNAHVRNVAKTIVEKHDPTFDFYGFYRDRVEEYPVACLVEIATSRKNTDAPWIEKFLTDPRPAVCRATMSALMQLNALHYAPQIMEMQASPQPGIAKTATQLIRRFQKTAFF